MDVVARMETLQTMVDTEGWVVLLSFINSRIEDHKNQLITCPIDEVIKHRAKIEALQSVLIYISGAIEEGREELQRQPP